MFTNLNFYITAQFSFASFQAFWLGRHASVAAAGHPRSRFPPTKEPKPEPIDPSAQLAVSVGGFSLAAAVVSASATRRGRMARKRVKPEKRKKSVERVDEVRRTVDRFLDRFLDRFDGARPTWPDL